jgi:predicted CXXCH cytochrome family protein
MKYVIAIVGSLILALGVSGTAFAFHSGGVAECAGCHTMHGASNSSLLVGSDASSACLSCHENPADTGPSSYHVSTAAPATGWTGLPLHRTPGGDFSWVKKTFTWLDGTTKIENQEHGHNIVALDQGYTADTTNTTAPGGGTAAFSASQLGCQSCHDPHGTVRRLSDGTYARTGAPIIASGSYDNSPEPAAGQAVGVYRLLRGLNDDSQGPTFKDAAIAVAPSTYNRTEASTQTRVAYGATGSNTWGSWCGTCHSEMQTATGGKHGHPADENLGSTIATNYRKYVKSGDLTGDNVNGFLSLVPFVEGTGDFATLKGHAKNNDSVLTGPANADQVSCLSCHRAHASGWEFGLRWYTEYEFMTYDGKYVGMDNTSMTSSRKPVQTHGRNVADAQAAYYDRPATQFATYQRSLCNKCHAWD